jgi:hypothetical protein
MAKHGAPRNAGPPAASAMVGTTAPGTNLGFASNPEVDAKRDEYHFKRSYDGHVALQNKGTQAFWDVKLDLKSPGQFN